MISRSPEAVPSQSDAGAATAEFYNDSLIASRFVTASGGKAAAALVLSGLHCAGCARSVERALRSLAGVGSIDINFATRRARLDWDPMRCGLGDIVARIEQAGYHAHPYDPARRQQQIDRERRALLRRTLVAIALSMQIMMFAFALYFGAELDIEPWVVRLFQWISLVLTLPIMLYSATPFFRNAWRSIANRGADMDLPVALALLIAFGASAAATVGKLALPVYYDSISMFCALLLSARLIESGIRARSIRALDELDEQRPLIANRLAGTVVTRIAAERLVPGDLVLVQPGEIIPADGIVVSGSTTTSEGPITGESRAIRKDVGDPLLGGGTNHDGAITMRVTAVGEASVLGRIALLLHHAQSLPTDRRGLIDRIAVVFTLGVLLLASATALFWYLRGAADWLAITLSVLVVSCPCALSLATPAALAAAGGRLLRHGLLITRPGTLERLADISHVVFDKTGTLTRGEPRLLKTTTLGGHSAETCLRVAAALERFSRHPLARAFAAHDDPALATAEVRTSARGIEGRVAGVSYRLGAPDFALAGTDGVASADESRTLVVLATAGAPLAVFELADALRTEAVEVLAALRAMGIAISIASGDRLACVAALAGELGVSQYRGALPPEQKLALLAELRQTTGRVAAVGDGINDGPILAAADVGIALGGGAALSHDAAGLVILNDSLDALRVAIEIARRTRSVIRENLWWALGYNLIAIPAAAAGLLPPWAAALGMSLSSLLVVANAARLAR